MFQSKPGKDKQQHTKSLLFMILWLKKKRKSICNNANAHKPLKTGTVSRGYWVENVALFWLSLLKDRRLL